MSNMLKKSTITAARAQYANRLCITEHEIIEARALLERKEKDAQALRGSIATCDDLLAHHEPAEPEAPKSETK